MDAPVERHPHVSPPNWISDSKRRLANKASEDKKGQQNARVGDAAVDHATIVPGKSNKESVSKVGKLIKQFDDLGTRATPTPTVLKQQTINRTHFFNTKLTKNKTREC